MENNKKSSLKIFFTFFHFLYSWLGELLCWFGWGLNKWVDENYQPGDEFYFININGSSRKCD